MCWEQICHKYMKFRATEEGAKKVNKIRLNVGFKQSSKKTPTFKLKVFKF